MSRLSTIKPSAATGITADIFKAMRQAAGMVPNSYVTIATHSPMGLQAILSIDSVIEESTLTKTEIESVRLAVSFHFGCDYSIAAYSYLANFSGLSKPVIDNIKAGTSCGTMRLDVLLEFVRELLSSRGVLAINALEKLQGAGFTEQNMIEISLIVASTMFMNLINRVNDTAIDFPDAG